MEIGGVDIHFKNSWPIGAKKSVTARYLKAKWPNMVMEYLEGDEILFYENQEAKDSWDEHGCIDENSERMVHLLAQGDCITLVYDGDHLDIEKLKRKFGPII